MERPQAAAATQTAPTAPTGSYQVDIDLIDPNPYQPRTRFREEAIEELSRSIQTSGIIQPLVLRKMGARFQLIAGERRWRAAQRAGLQRVPAVFREVPEEQVLELTLVENLQREDLNPVEEARAFDRLLNEFHLTQEEVGSRTGKDRATIANAVRLLRLEKSILEMMEEGRLTGGHARALLGVTDAAERQKLAHRIARGGLTVRQLERFIVRKARGSEAAKKEAAELDANTRAALEELERHLGTKVTLRLKAKNRAGQLQIEYYDDAQLAGIYDKLMH
ncbi:MAG TPA: ParB/RepB/Spo0J family partition protein [Candidatus Acidoferrales bacterium]|nr:ParB/RepB/Spo0J family partition protein [Candidatus Acidoferrales bacterium]